MKSNIIKASLVAGTAFALALGVNSAEPVKGGERQLNLLGIKTAAEAEVLKPGDAMAMVCTKCKSVVVTYVQKDMKGHVTRMVPGEKHLCPDCNSTIEVIGVGKAAKQ